MLELLFDKLLNSVVQIALASLIPLIWWGVTTPKSTPFLNWIGITKTITAKKTLSIFIAVISIFFIAVSIGILFLLKDIETATSDFSGMGIAALPAALVYAFLNTALSEEILFRGFLLKRLSARFGFKIGNIIQSVLFGSLHGFMFIALAGIWKALLITLFTGAIAWCMGYINEKKADGSILPSWIIHGIANTFSALVAMFSII